MLDLSMNHRKVGLHQHVVVAVARCRPDLPCYLKGPSVIMEDMWDTLPGAQPHNYEGANVPST
jgi:hypothetical protein